MQAKMFLLTMLSSLPIFQSSPTRFLMGGTDRLSTRLDSRSKNLLRRVDLAAMTSFFMLPSFTAQDFMHASRFYCRQ